MVEVNEPLTTSPWCLLAKIYVETHRRVFGEQWGAEGSRENNYNGEALMQINRRNVHSLTTWPSPALLFPFHFLDPILEKLLHTGFIALCKTRKGNFSNAYFNELIWVLLGSTYIFDDSHTHICMHSIDCKWALLFRWERALGYNV